MRLLVTDISVYRSSNGEHLYRSEKHVPGDTTAGMDEVRLCVVSPFPTGPCKHHVSSNDPELYTTPAFEQELLYPVHHSIAYNSNATMPVDYNVFRILGDVSHTLSKCILIWAIHSNKSAEGKFNHGGHCSLAFAFMVAAEH